MKYLLLIVIMFFIISCGKEDSNNSNNNNNPTCTQNYVTSDLSGCFSPNNSDLLEYYCFDGAGNWYHEIWNPISGCGGAIESGTYSVDKCTLNTCDNTGCYDYPVSAYDGGVIINGAYYSSTNSCN